MSSRSPVTYADAFRDGYLVSVWVFQDRKWKVLGSGVLLAPRVVATCRHVVDGYRRVGVRLGEDRREAQVFTTKGKSEYDDVALLVVDEDLAHAPYPMLLSGVTDRHFEALRSLFAPPSNERTRWRAAGAPEGAPMRSQVRITNCHTEADGLAARYQLGEGYVEGWSGGPVWLMPKASEWPAWKPGLVLGLLTRSDNGAGHGFAATSDMLLAFRARVLKLLHKQPGDSASSAFSALEKVRTVDAEDLVRSPRSREIIDFTLERSRHKHFFGREDVLAKMDAWVEDRVSGWLLITGSPGLGKSALLNEWLRRREDVGLRTAFHFIRRGHLDWAEPQVVQRNLAAQIEVMFPEQRDPDADSVYRLEQLLGRVGQVLTERDERLALLVDGLDEAMTLGKDNPIPYIFPLEVPDRVFVVTASRPQYPHLGWFDRRNGASSRFDLDVHAESNERAVREYWSVLGKAMQPPLSDALARAAVDGAHGNLLHAVKLHQLWGAAGAERLVDAVPRGLEGMLGELWRRIEELPSEQRTLARRGLSLLCAARESMPLRVVGKLLGWDEGDAQADFLPLVREMLLEEPWHEAPAYRPFHERLREVVEEQLVDTMGEHRRLLAEYASWPVEGDEFRCGYALRHRVEHLVEAGRFHEAAGTVMDVGYLTGKACAEGVDAVERDIRLAAKARERDEIRDRLTMLGRLVTASAHWASEVPQALAALLHDRALTNAPELLGELFGPTRHPLEHPRLRHPLQVRGMSRILQGHEGAVTALAVLPDGRIVSASSDETLRVWDAQTGRIIATLRGHRSSVDALVVLRDGRVVSGSYDGTVHVWNVDTGQILASILRYGRLLTNLAVLPAQGVVSCWRNGDVRVWDMDTGRRLIAPADDDYHEGTAHGLAVLPDGRVVQDSLGTMLVWDVQDKLPDVTLRGHADWVNALTVLPDGHVISGSSDQSLCVWNLQTPQDVTILRGHTGEVTALATLPDGRVISGSCDKTLRVWDVQTRRTMTTLRGHTAEVMALAVLPDGRFVSGSADSTLRIWDVPTGAAFAARHNQSYRVTVFAVLPDGDVVSGSSDGTIQVWDVQTGRPLATLHGHTDRVSAITALPDDRIVSGSSDGTVRVWDMKTRQTTAILQGHLLDVRSLAVLPDGRVASGSSDNTVRVWDVKTRQPLAILHGHTDEVNALAALPGGRLVSASPDNTMRVWDVETGHPLATLHSHADGLRAFTALVDGRVVSVSSDSIVRAWDMQTGQLLATFQNHDNQVNALAALSDNCVVSALSDNTVRVWDVKTGETIATIYGDAPFDTVACIDQRFIVAGDTLGNVWFIDLPCSLQEPETTIKPKPQSFWGHVTSWARTRLFW